MGQRESRAGLAAHKYGLAFGCAAALLLADQISKYAVIQIMPLNSAIEVIPGFFDLVHIRNRGAAFGFLNRSDIEWQFWFFCAATTLAIVLILLILRRSRGQILLSCGLGLVLGGAIGNFIDRVRYRSVVDFLDCYLGDLHWPAFNIADVGICIGAALVCVAIWQAEHKKAPA